MWRWLCVCVCVCVCVCTGFAGNHSVIRTLDFCSRRPNCAQRLLVPQLWTEGTMSRVLRIFHSGVLFVPKKAGVRSTRALKDNICLDRSEICVGQHTWVLTMFNCVLDITYPPAFIIPKSLKTGSLFVFSWNTESHGRRQVLQKWNRHIRIPHPLVSSESKNRPRFRSLLYTKPKAIFYSRNAEYPKKNYVFHGTANSVTHFQVSATETYFIMNWIYTALYFLLIHINVILPPTYLPPKLYVSFKFCDRDF